MATSIPRTPRNAPAKAARSPVPGIVAVLLFFSLIGGAIYVAVWADRANSSSAQEPVEDPDAHKPFSSVEPEALPDMSGSNDRSIDKSAIVGPHDVPAVTISSPPT